MGHFNKEKRFSGGGRGGKKFGGRNFGGNRSGDSGFGGGRDGVRPDMHKAVCSNCGNDCEVPFRPTGDKPVFCNTCFKNKRGNDGSRVFQDGGSRDFGNRESRPQFTDKHSHQNEDSRNLPNYKAQFEQLNAKLDKILKTLVPVVVEEVGKEGVPISKGFKKSPKKEVDTVALKKIIIKAMDKKPVTRKVATKKTVAKVVKKKKK